MMAARRVNRGKRTDACGRSVCVMAHPSNEMVQPTAPIFGSEFQLPTDPDEPAPLQLRAVQRLHERQFAQQVQMLAL